MSNINKTKISSTSPLQRIFDDILFTRDFHHISDLSPDDIQLLIQDMAFQPDTLTRVFFPRRRLVDIIKVSDQHYRFTIKTKVGGLYTELTTIGHINYDPATGKSSVTGQVKFDAMYLAVLLVGLFVLITWSLASLSRTGILASPFILLTLSLTNLFYFRQMFTDRNDLLNTLEESLTTDNISGARNRLADKAKTDHLNEISHQPKQQSQEI